YIDVTDKDYVYFPISIGQMGLSIFTTYVHSKLDKDKERFLKFVDWFYNNTEKSNELGIRWMTDVSLPAYGNPGPWQSAFSQGRGISILLRGYQLTGNKKYKEMAAEALIPFTKPVDKGGVTSYTNWGPIYEEYTAKFPTLVLNGHIFALFGIYDFVRVFPDNKKARHIWDDGVMALKNSLPDYDLGWWTRYNYCKDASYPSIDPATIKYQNLHISQLEVMAKITGDSIFSEYAKKWETYLKTRNYVKSYIIKYHALKKIGRL
ncbi:MAG: hypothetical protein KAR38_14945, partial [Calditrichia bacterium]|nr:hypothetical protein [Calditrichia bacterium]